MGIIQFNLSTDIVEQKELLMGYVNGNHYAATGGQRSKAKK